MIKRSNREVNPNRQEDSNRRLEIMNRYVTLLGILIAVIVVIFSVANVAEDMLFLLLAGAVVLIGIGSITGH